LIEKKKYITLRIVGGLGNQLFIFCFLNYLSIKLKIPILVDRYSGYQTFLGGNRYNQIFLLDKMDYEFFFQERKLCFLGFLGKFKRFLVKNFTIFSSFFDVDYIQEKNCKDILLEIKNSKKNNIYIEGYFQDIKYFKSHKFNLIKKIETAFTRKDFKLVNLNQSICICLSNYSYGNILDSKDYVNNINFFLEKNKNKFKYLYIFSAQFDEIFNLINFKKKIFINPQKKTNSFENLYVMSKFKYFIIDNSTYHWWGACLSSFKDKIIYTQKDFNSKLTSKSFKKII
jgi:hypothetical protein